MCYCENLNDNYVVLKPNYKHHDLDVEVSLFTDDAKWFIETVELPGEVISTIQVIYCPFCGRKF